MPIGNCSLQRANCAAEGRDPAAVTLTHLHTALVGTDGADLDARVRHFVYVSIVGVDRIPVAYYRHKLEAERRVVAGGMPWTIVRATQFHDLIDVWCGALAKSRSTRSRSC